MNLRDFLNLERKEIASIVKKRKKPLCVAIMLDGTRRMLKLEAGHSDDKWLYDESHIRKLIYKSVETADMLFEMGIEMVVGPLASLGNLHRTNFMPEGLRRLLNLLAESYSTAIFRKNGTSVSFYGDLDYAKSMPGGEVNQNDTL